VPLSPFRRRRTVQVVRAGRGWYPWSYNPLEADREVRRTAAVAVKFTAPFYPSRFNCSVGASKVNGRLTVGATCVIDEAPKAMESASDDVLT